jgi:Rod binding domain-containing protein
VSLGLGGTGESSFPAPTAMQKMKTKGVPGSQSSQSFEELLQNASAKSGSNDISRSVLGDAGRPQGDTRDERLKKVSEKIEGMFMNMMVEEMRETVPETSIAGDSPGKKMFQARLDRKYAKTMAKSKDFGIAEAIYEQFTGKSASDVDFSERSGEAGKDSDSDSSGNKSSTRSSGGNLSRSQTPRAAFGGL